MAEVTEMFLCETERLGLHHDQLYVFRVDPTCSRCKELAAMAPEGFVPPHPEGTGIYTETERDAAVAGAYRAAADACSNSLNARYSYRMADGEYVLPVGHKPPVDAILALTPASAQKAFADAVAAEVARNLHAYRTTAEEMKQQLTRLTEEKERLRAALRAFGNHRELCIHLYNPGNACNCGFEAALTPAAGGETRGK